MPIWEIDWLNDCISLNNHMIQTYDHMIHLITPVTNYQKNQLQVLQPMATLTYN